MKGSTYVFNFGAQIIITSSWNHNSTNVVRLETAKCFSPLHKSILVFAEGITSLWIHLPYAPRDIFVPYYGLDMAWNSSNCTSINSLILLQDRPGSAPPLGPIVSPEYKFTIMSSQLPSRLQLLSLSKWDR